MSEASEAGSLSPDSLPPEMGEVNSFGRLTAARKVVAIAAALREGDWEFLRRCCFGLPWSGAGGLAEVVAQLQESPEEYFEMWRPRWRWSDWFYKLGLELPDTLEERALFRSWLDAWLRWAREAPRAWGAFPKGLPGSSAEVRQAWREGWLAALRTRGMRASAVPSGLRRDPLVVLGAWREGRSPVGEYRQRLLRAIVRKKAAPSCIWEEGAGEDLLEFREAWAATWLSFLRECPHERLRATPPEQLIHLPQVQATWRKRVCRVLDNQDAFPLNLREWTSLPVALTDHPEVLHFWSAAWLDEIEEAPEESLTVLDIPPALRQHPKIRDAAVRRKLQLPPWVASPAEINSLYVAVDRNSALFRRLCEALAREAFPDWAVPRPLRKMPEIQQCFREGWIRQAAGTPLPQKSIPEVFGTSEAVYRAWQAGWENALEADPFPASCAPEILRREAAFQERHFLTWAGLLLKKGWILRDLKRALPDGWWSNSRLRLRVEKALRVWLAAWQICPQIRTFCGESGVHQETHADFWKRAEPLHAPENDASGDCETPVRSGHGWFLLQAASVLFEDFVPHGIPKKLKAALRVEAQENGTRGCGSSFETLCLRLANAWKDCIRNTPLTVHRIPGFLRTDAEYGSLYAGWLAAWAVFVQQTPVPFRDVPEAVQADPDLREVWRAGWLGCASREPLAPASLPRVLQRDPELLEACERAWIQHVETCAVQRGELPLEFAGNRNVEAAWKTGWFRRIETDAVEFEEIPEDLREEVLGTGRWRAGWVCYLEQVCGAPRTVPQELLEWDSGVRAAWTEAWERRIRRTDFTLWDAEALPYKVYPGILSSRWCVGSLLEDARIRALVYDRCARLALRQEDPLNHLPRFAADSPEAVALVFKYARSPLAWSAIPDRLKRKPEVCRAWLAHQVRPPGAMLYAFERLRAHSSGRRTGMPGDLERSLEGAFRTLMEAPWLFAVSWGEFEALKSQPKIFGKAVEGFVRLLRTDPLVCGLVPNLLRDAPEMVEAFRRQGIPRS